MKKKLAVICGVIWLVTSAPAQIRLDTATSVSKSDPIYPVLQKYWDEILKKYANSRNFLPPVNPRFLTIESPAVKRVFPSLRIAAVFWSERKRPGAPESPLPDFLGVTETLAIEKSSSKIQLVLMEYGNYEEFGILLAKNRVRIEDADDAKAVWDAFCDMHHKHWKDQPASKESETIWHLGNVTIDRFHYYYEVVLDERRAVKSARLHADEVKKRQPE